MSKYRNRREIFGQESTKKKIKGNSESSIIFDFKLSIYIPRSSEPFACSGCTEIKVYRMLSLNGDSFIYDTECMCSQAQAIRGR